MVGGEVGGNVDLREGDAVYFALESVYLPAMQEVVASLKPADQLVGTIMQFSESDAGVRAFAVVSLTSRSNVVVPVEKLARVAAGPGDRR